MPPFPNMPPKKYPLPIPHYGVLALPPPPRRLEIQNQVSALPILTSSSSNIGSNPNEAKRIR